MVVKNMLTKFEKPTSCSAIYKHPALFVFLYIGGCFELSVYKKITIKQNKQNINKHN